MEEVKTPTWTDVLSVEKNGHLKDSKNLRYATLGEVKRAAKRCLIHIPIIQHLSVRRDDNNNMSTVLMKPEKIRMTLPLTQ